MKIIPEIPGGIIISHEEAAQIFAALLVIAKIGLSQKDPEANKLHELALSIAKNMPHFGEAAEGKFDA